MSWGVYVGVKGGCCDADGKRLSVFTTPTHSAGSQNTPPRLRNTAKALTHAVPVRCRASCEGPSGLWTNVQTLWHLGHAVRPTACEAEAGLPVACSTQSLAMMPASGRCASMLAWSPTPTVRTFSTWLASWRKPTALASAPVPALSGWRVRMGPKVASQQGHVIVVGRVSSSPGEGGSEGGWPGGGGGGEGGVGGMGDGW